MNCVKWNWSFCQHFDNSLTNYYCLFDIFFTQLLQWCQTLLRVVLFHLNWKIWAAANPSIINNQHQIHGRFCKYFISAGVNLALFLNTYVRCLVPGMSFAVFVRFLSGTIFRMTKAIWNNSKESNFEKGKTLLVLFEKILK